MRQITPLLLLAALLASCFPQEAPPPASASPSLAPTSTATEIAEITNSAINITGALILSPGDGSQLISPLIIDAKANPGETDLVRLALVTQNGAIRVRQLIELSEAAELQVPLVFEVSRPTQARLILNIEDEFDRLKVLDSVGVLLLPDGINVIEPRTSDNPALMIEQPAADDESSGGRLLIRGRATSRPGRPLNVELITRAGRVLAFGETYPDFEGGSVTGAFQIELNYDIEEPQWVLIAIAEREGGQIIQYTSLEVWLEP